MGCAQDGLNAIILSVKSVRTADPELPRSVRYCSISTWESLTGRLIARSITLWNDRPFSSTPRPWDHIREGRTGRFPERSLRRRRVARINTASTFGPFEVLPPKVTTSTRAPERRDTYGLIFLIDFDCMAHHGPTTRDDVPLGAPRARLERATY
jgi:hypothetical protein